MVTTIIPSICRPYHDATTARYKDWYHSSTRTLLTAPPPARPTHRTREEQLVRGTERTAAYQRDSSVLAVFIKIILLSSHIYISDNLLIF